MVSISQKEFTVRYVYLSTGLTVCFCEDDNELTVFISGKEFTIRSVSLKTGSKGVLLWRW